MDLSYESFKKGKLKVNKSKNDLSYSTFLANKEKQNQINTEKQSRISQGLPVSVKSNRATPTMGGNLVRGAIKPFADVASNILGGADLSNKYLGNVEGLGKIDITKSPLDKENLKTVKRSVLTGLEIGSYATGGGAAVGAGKNVVKQGAKEFLKTSGKQLVKEGAITSGLGSIGYQGRDGKINPLQVLRDTAIGAVASPLLGVGANKLFGKGTPQIANKVDGLIPENTPNPNLINKGLNQVEIPETPKIDPGQAEIPKMGNTSSVIEFKNISKGHEKFSNQVDNLVKDKSIFPEEANIIREVFRDTKEEILNSFDIKSNSRLRSVYGRAVFTPQRVPKELQLKKGLAGVFEFNKSDRLPSSTFFHEYGHIAKQLLFDENDNALISKVFKQMGKEGRTNFFDNGLYAPTKTRTNKYYTTNEEEFFVQSFAEYVISKKVPEESLRPLYERVYIKLKEALIRILKRGETPTDELIPIYEKMLSGDKNLSKELLELRLKGKNVNKQIEFTPNIENKLNNTTEFKDLDPEVKKTTFEEIRTNYNTLSQTKSVDDLIDISMGKKEVPQGLTKTSVYELTKNRKDLTIEQIKRLKNIAPESEAGLNLVTVKLRDGGIIDNPTDLIQATEKVMKEKASKAGITKKTIGRFLDDIECK